MRRALLGAVVVALLRAMLAGCEDGAPATRLRIDLEACRRERLLRLGEVERGEHALALLGAGRHCDPGLDRF